MGPAKRFLDLAVDFMFFIFGCLYMVAGFANTASVQNVLNRTITDKGSAVMADAYPETFVGGEEVIALLLYPDGVVSVSVDGVEFVSEFERSIDYIAMEKNYMVTRAFGLEGTKLIITACAD